MYRVFNMNTGKYFDVEKPRYVKKTPLEIWVQCNEDEAQCISINGERYSILNREPVEDAPQTVIVKPIDAGEQLNNLLRENLQQAETLEEVKAAIIDCYDCILDLYESDWRNQ